MISINVRQNEIIVVQGTEMEWVSHLFTVGMNPCVGIAMWMPGFAALGHIDYAENIPACAPLINHCKTFNANLAITVVRAKNDAAGAPPTVKGSASHAIVDKREAEANAEATKATTEALNNAFRIFNPANYEVKKWGKAAKVGLNLQSGHLDYGIAAGLKGSVVSRRPENERWVDSVAGPNVKIRFGFFSFPNSIEYISGDAAVPLTEALERYRRMGIPRVIREKRSNSMSSLLDFPHRGRELL